MGCIKVSPSHSWLFLRASTGTPYQLPPLYRGGVSGLNPDRLNFFVGDALLVQRNLCEVERADQSVPHCGVA